MYSNNIRVLEWNFVSNFKQSVKKIRRFKILGDSMGSEGHSLSMYFLMLYKKKLLYSNGKLSQNL